MSSFNSRLKYDLGLEDNMFDASDLPADTGLTEEVAVFSDETNTVEEDLVNLEKTEVAVQSLESIRASLESIIKDNVNSQHALIMANASLESIEMTFGLKVNSISLEDETTEDAPTSMFSKVASALAAVKNGAVQLVGKIGLSIEAMFGSVSATATKFKSKLSGLKSKADNAEAGKPLNLGKTANKLATESGSVDGTKYIKELTSTMSTMGNLLNTFKTVDDLTALANAVSESGKFDSKTFNKKFTTLKNLAGKKMLGGTAITVEHPVTVEEIKAFLDECIEKYKQHEKGETVSTESDGTGKRALWKRIIGWIFVLDGMLAATTIATTGFSGLVVSMIFVMIGRRLVTGKWFAAAKRPSMEDYTVSMESMDTNSLAKEIYEISTKFELISSEVKVSSVTSLDSKQVNQVADMLSTLADNAIAYANSAKSRKKAVSDIGSSLNKLTKKQEKNVSNAIVDQTSAKVIERLKNTLALETKVNKQTIDVIRGGTAYIEASVK